MYPIGYKPLTQAMFHSMLSVMTDQNTALFPLNAKILKFLLIPDKWPYMTAPAIKHSLSRRAAEVGYNPRFFFFMNLLLGGHVWTRLSHL